MKHRPKFNPFEEGWRPPAESLDFTFPQDFLHEEGLKNFAWNGVLAAGEVSVVYGDPDAGKGNFATTIACSVATASPFFGRPCGWLRDDGEWWPAGVLYFALERERQVRNRIDAFRRSRDIEFTLPLAVCGAQFDIRADGAGEMLAETLYAAHDATRMPSDPSSSLCDYKPDFNLAIIDTWAMALQGGSDSNPDDVGRAIINVKKFAAETGAHVMVLTHTPVGGTVMRGLGNLNAAIDVSLHVVNRKGTRTATVIKNSDGADHPTFHYRLESVDVPIFNRESCFVGHEPAAALVELDGPPATAIPASVARKAKKEPKPKQPSASEIPAYSALVAVGEPVTEKAWRARYDAEKVEGISEQAHRTRFTRAKVDLVKKGLIAANDNDGELRFFATAINT